MKVITIVLLALAVSVSSAYAMPQCTQENGKYTCTVSTSGISVMQEGLDDADLSVLHAIWYLRENGWSVVADNPEPEAVVTYPFAQYQVTQDDLKAEEDTAFERLCTDSLYLPNFKKQQGCKLNDDGTYSAR